VLAGALTLAVALVALPKAASAALEPDNFPPETLGPEYCGFEVPYEVSDNRVILTNVGTGEQVTYVATGTIRVPELEGGELLMVTTDRPRQSEHRHSRADRTIYLRHRRGGQLLTADGQREAYRRLRTLSIRRR
jgi:hypothetical protein